MSGRHFSIVLAVLAQAVCWGGKAFAVGTAKNNLLGFVDFPH